jgi:tRNA U34 5-methylaminomethyl-2-thiouridine-forming methyltransferase MnmC
MHSPALVRRHKAQLATQMQKITIETADGSPTILLPELNLTYHSKFGALQESRHVFIEAGLLPFMGRYEVLSVFEMGFGTGLNALLTLQQAEHKRQNIHYTAIELHPLLTGELQQLNFFSFLHHEKDILQLRSLHDCTWEKQVMLTPFFTIHKQKANLADLTFLQPVHVIYFDAFDPSVQPELWTENIFRKLYNMLVNGGVLVTYSCKGNVRRAMQSAGFTTEKIPGPPGKREMLRAYKQ